MMDPSVPDCPPDGTEPVDDLDWWHGSEPMYGEHPPKPDDHDHPQGGAGSRVTRS